MASDHWPAWSRTAVLLVAASLVPTLTADTPSGVQPASQANQPALVGDTFVAPRDGTPRTGLSLAGDPELDLILERACDYVAAFFNDFSAAVAEEEYVQTAFTEPVPGLVGAGKTGRRVLRSDFLLVRRPDNEQLMPFRDVFEVDGRPVRDRQERLQKLFLEKPASAMADASRIAQESSRYNIGPIDRTVNVPTLPLQFLQRRYLPRFKFKKARQEIVDTLRVWRIDYSEKARPTLIRRRGGEDVPAEGAFWIDAATGRVVRTRLRVEIPRDPATMQGPEVVGAMRDETPGRAALDAEIIVTYRASDTLGVWVPSEMKEVYLYGVRRITAVATYSNFRRFQILTEETVKVPK